MTIEAGMSMSDDTEGLEVREREKANEALGEMIEVLDKHKLRVQDLVVVYGNLGYAIGAAIEGFKEEKGPDVEELQKLYHSDPTVGVALMLQGMLVTSWHDQIINKK